VAALGALVVLLGLGTWQVERLRWKEAVIAERTSQLTAEPIALPAADDWAAWDFRRVEVAGVFDHDREQLFGASTHQGELGHHVLTPLRRDDGSVVLVDRGWVPAGRAHPAARWEGQVQGPVAVTGIARYRAADQAGWFTPANQPETRMWYRYDLPGFEQALGLTLLPLVIEADDQPNPGGLPIGGLTQVTLTNNHLQYAVTWYGLALTLVAVYVAFSLQRGGRR
jgi:surfeit locus 1 family protein